MSDSEAFSAVTSISVPSASVNDDGDETETESEGSKGVEMLDYWYPVCFSRNFPDSKPMAVQLFSEPLVIFRGTNREVVCLQDRCAHRYVSLLIELEDKTPFILLPPTPSSLLISFLLLSSPSIFSSFFLLSTSLQSNSAVNWSMEERRRRMSLPWVAVW